MNVQENLQPIRPAKKGNKYGAKEDFNPMEIVYKKYFVNQNMRHIMVDFETYSSCARNGGTISKMRDPTQDKDEDIRGTIV
jgi:hypothetical protein